MGLGGDGVGRESVMFYHNFHSYLFASFQNPNGGGGDKNQNCLTKTLPVSKIVLYERVRGKAYDYIHYYVPLQEKWRGR